ncbi:WD repeat-containing protein on Y chromosome-like [Acipenser ruthenus]|uniref:WD repeat-containing protein on Y chromosome-like n=1 Tax=Acipenser ruthenus TaxID=7906 RepID=UPI002740714E|nr:WD repeat-containing protein on Y chromosome-like [Acipenser ruthenus]
MYLPMGDLIITSSGSTSTSVVIMDLNRKNKVYTWKIHKPFCALLVSCGDYIGMLKLEQRGAWQDMLFTYTAKLSITIYNPFFRQVMIGCGCVGRGDRDKVSPAEQRPRARGDDRHVLRHHADTAHHRNGTIKVWNVQNGHNLYKLEPVAEAEVTRVLCYQDHKFLAVGWSRQLALYNTTDHRNTYVVADLSWRGGQLHKEDILAADSCPVLELLATASFDEDIIAWNTETQQVQAQGPLKKPSLLYSWRAHDSTVVSVELLSYDSESFLKNASADKTAWLWTSDGKYMGTIGHEKWILKNPATYQHTQ